MATKTNTLPEREYIAILGLVMPLVDAKRSQSLTPANFDAKSYAIEVIEALAVQRLDDSVPDPAIPDPEPEAPVEPESPESPVEPEPEQLPEVPADE